MIVIDASVVIDFLLNTASAGQIADRVFRAGKTLHAPHLLDAEVAHVLRRYSLSGNLSASRGEEAIMDFLDLPVVRYPHDVLLLERGISGKLSPPTMRCTSRLPRL